MNYVDKYFFHPYEINGRISSLQLNTRGRIRDFMANSW